MCERLRLLPWRQKVILALAGVGLLAHVTISIARVGHKIGDYDINREFGRRFLAGQSLYQGGQCYNYMPISALYWAPMALVPSRAGMALRYLTALACLLISIRILRNTRPSPFSIIIVTLILGGHYLIRDFDDGGPNVILLAILLGGMSCVWRGRDLLGAFWLGLGIAAKLTPGLVLPYLLWKRRWRAATYTTTATILWILLPALWMGPASWWRHQQQWNEVALSVVHDSSDAGRDLNEQRVQNQALKPALLRYLVTYPSSHPLRLEQAGYVDFLNWSPSTAGRAASGVLLVLGLVSCWATRRRVEETPRVFLREISGLFLLMLLFSPVTWLQHFVFALPAIYWIVTEQQAAPRKLRLGGIVLFAILALLMNRELLGRDTYLLLLSYHTHTLCLLLLFALVISAPSSEYSAEKEEALEFPAAKNKAA